MHYSIVVDFLMGVGYSGGMIDIVYDELLGYRSVFVCEHCMVTYRSDELFGSSGEAFINGEVEEALHKSLPHVILEGV